VEFCSIYPNSTASHKIPWAAKIVSPSDDLQLHVIDDDVPLDVVGVADVMSLHLLINIVQDDDGGDEVDDLTSRQQVHITPSITATIAIAAGSVS